MLGCPAGCWTLNLVLITHEAAGDAPKCIGSQRVLHAISKQESNQFLPVGGRCYSSGNLQKKTGVIGTDAE